MVVTAELDVAEASWIKASFVTIRLVVMRLRMIRLGRKFKKGLSPRICLSPRIRLSLLWTFLPPELN